FSIMKDFHSVERELRGDRGSYFQLNMSLTASENIEGLANTLFVYRQIEHGPVGYKRFSRPQACDPLLVCKRAVHLYISSFASGQRAANSVQETIRACRGGQPNAAVQ